MSESTVRFGQVLVGEEFRLPGSPVVLRRTQGLSAKPVAHIGGHISVYGGSEVSLSTSVEVERVAGEERSIERPRG